VAVAALREDAIDAAQRALAKDGLVQLALPPHVEPPVQPLDLSGLDWPLLQYFVWAVLALGAIVILVSVWRRFRASPKRAAAIADASTANTWRPEPGQARILLSEADGLADAGRFDEAAHLLLLRSIEQIAAKQPAAVRPALTSRDIGAEPGLPGDVRDAFRMIAAIVERSFFGGRGIDANDWHRCRSAYAGAALGREWA
jgi:hypothetical protein